ncbi:uncharacterized protein EHS24_005821 [Apiotrichum porosum]|uniref:Stress-associated endoplasmic reticulum protein n=1 Tax=Apiotrichum porosum TaxID=105984 RepID=A0A427XZJ9_9TREE|nr:uncharacterized protein EHS24_005821 [Apiotrichum porosum]RSH84306.1 hypothetical protein EHS24_005821 [Apiotrichum porosum]
MVNQQPSQADIRRKNANFVARATAGKSTTRPARSKQRGVGTWVLAGLFFLLVGGTVVELIRLIFSL